MREHGGRLVLMRKHGVRLVPYLELGPGTDIIAWDRAVLWDFRFIVEVFILSEILEQAEYHKTDSITYTCI